MIPTNTILDRLCVLLQTDATTLAHATLAVKVHLAKNAFVPATSRIIADFVEANFTGFAAKLAGLGTQQFFNDPSTGLRVVQLLEPAGGWHWQCGDALQLPQTIYGFYVTDNATAVLYGSALLPAPVVLAGTGDAIDIGNVRFNFSPSSPT